MESALFTDINIVMWIIFTTTILILLNSLVLGAQFRSRHKVLRKEIERLRKENTIYKEHERQEQEKKDKRKANKSNKKLLLEVEKDAEKDKSAEEK